MLHLCSALVRHLVFVSRTREMQMYWKESGKVQWRGWSTWHTQRGWKKCLVWSRESSGGSHLRVQIHEGMLRRVRLFLAMCIERARDKLKDGYLIQGQEKNPFYCECGQMWESIAQKDCGGLHLWRYTKPDQTQPWATCSCSSITFLCKHMEIP